MQRGTPTIATTALVLVSMACGSPGAAPSSAPATTPAPTAAPTSTPPTTTVPTTTGPTTTEPSTTAPTTEPPASEELGTCEVMGPSDGGWEVLLRIPAVLGGGSYRVEYALRDEMGAVLDRMGAEISLSEDDVVQYWDSPRSPATDVASCDVLRLLQGSEACAGLDDCVLSA